MIFDIKRSLGQDWVPAHDIACWMNFELQMLQICLARIVGCHVGISELLPHRHGTATFSVYVWQLHGFWEPIN